MVWNIVCDSSCDLRATDVKSESVQFETVPLRLQVGAREFLDNDQLEVPDLLQAMAAEKSASSTACRMARAVSPVRTRVLTRSRISRARAWKGMPLS